MVGVFRMVLQRLINELHLDITDSLLDGNNTVLKVIIFSLHLQSLRLAYFAIIISESENIIYKRSLLIIIFMFRHKYH